MNANSEPNPIDNLPDPAVIMVPFVEVEVGREREVVPVMDWGTSAATVAVARLELREKVALPVVTAADGLMLDRAAVVVVAPT